MAGFGKPTGFNKATGFNSPIASFNQSIGFNSSDTSAFNPLSNANLKVWVEMDSGVTTSAGKISTIANQASTGSTYDAVMRTGDSASNLPSYSPAGGQRNKPYAYFDASGTQRLMLATPLVFAAGSGFDIFWSGAPQRKANTTQPILFGSTTTNSTFQWTSFKSLLIRTDSSSITFDGTTTQQIGTLDDQKHIFRLSRMADGSTCQLSVDKMVIAQFALTGTFTLDSIGWSSGLSLMHGPWYLLAAYNAYQGNTRTETYPATLTEAGKVEDFLCDKYDFAQRLFIQATESTSNCTVSAGIDSSYGVTGQMATIMRQSGFTNYTIFNEAVVGSTLALSGTRADADASVSGNIFGIRKRNYNRFRDKPILFAWCGGNDIGAANSTILTRYTTYVDACNATAKFKAIYGATIYIAMGAPGDTNAAAGYPIISSWNAWLLSHKPTNMTAIADVGAQTHLAAGVDVMDVVYYYAGDPQVQHLNHIGNSIVASLFVTTITANLVADAISFSQLPLDIVTGASAAYALLKLRTGYTGSAIRVRRSSDDTESDFGFDVTGYLDTAALLTFTGASNGFITKWYDQSRYSNDAVQATGASQPKIVNAGAVVTANSLPTIQFDGAASTLDMSATGLSIIRNCIGATCFTVGKSANSGAIQNVVYFSEHADATLQRFGLTKTAANAYSGGFRPKDTDTGGVATGSADSANTLAVNSATANAWVPNATLYQNGAQVAIDKAHMTINTPKAVEDTAALAARIGASGSTAAAFLNGTLSAVVIYTSELTIINRHTIEQVAGSAYGITIS